MSQHNIVNCQIQPSELHGVANTISSICTAACKTGRSPYGGCGQTCDRPECGIKHAPLARGGRCVRAPLPQSSLHPAPACLQRTLSSIRMSSTAFFALGFVEEHTSKEQESVCGSVPGGAAAGYDEVAIMAAAAPCGAPHPDHRPPVAFGSAQRRVYCCFHFCNNLLRHVSIEQLMPATILSWRSEHCIYKGTSGVASGVTSGSCSSFYTPWLHGICVAGKSRITGA